MFDVNELFETYVVGFHVSSGKEGTEQLSNYLNKALADGIVIDEDPALTLASLTVVKPSAIVKYGDEAILKEYAKYMNYRGAALIRVPKLANGTFHPEEKTKNRVPLSFLTREGEYGVKVPKECILGLWGPEVMGDKVLKNFSFNPPMIRHRKFPRQEYSYEQLHAVDNLTRESMFIPNSVMKNKDKWTVWSEYKRYLDERFDRYYTDRELNAFIPGRYSIDSAKFSDIFDMHTNKIDLPCDYSYADILATSRVMSPSITSDYVDCLYPSSQYFTRQALETEIDTKKYFANNTNYRRAIKGPDTNYENTFMNIKNRCVVNNCTGRLVYPNPMKHKAVISHKFRKLCYLCDVPVEKIEPLWNSIMQESVYDKKHFNNYFSSRNYYDLRRMLSIARNICGNAGEMVVTGLFNINGNTPEVAKSFDANINMATQLKKGGYVLDPEWEKFRQQQERY